MPRLSDSMEEGTILTWMKQEGDEVAVGDELVEIETDKANMAYESDVAGTLSRILAQEGDTLAIGTPIAVVGDPGDGNGAAPATQGAQPADTSPTDTPAGASSSNAGDPLPPHTPQEGITPTSAQSAGVSVGEGTDEGTRVKASPIAKRIARESGVDLSTLTGSGPGGRIVKADVEKAGGGRFGSLIAGRSVAIDADQVPMGAILFVKGQKPIVESGQITGWEPFTRIVLGQDTGAGIKGARMDMYFGDDEYALAAAQAMSVQGQAWVLMSK